MARNNGNKSITVVQDKPKGEAILIIPSQAVEIAPSSPPLPQTVAMTAGASMAEAGRGLLYNQLQKLRKAEPIAREGSDPEGVHDMRVATRRLRAALKVLEETVYDRKQTARYRKELRGLANALGVTRDADVFMEHLNVYTAMLPDVERAGLEPLHRELESRRTQGRKEMLKVLDNARTEKLLRKLEHFAATPGAGVADRETEQDEIAPSLVRHFAGSAIWRRYEEVLAYETAIGPGTPIEVLHRLRVACKRLRYTLEFFQDALPSGVKTAQKQLVEVQDDLGALHDHQVAIELCESLLRSRPDDLPLRTYQSSRTKDIERIRLEFNPHWQTLTGAAYKRQLATALAGSSSETK